MTLMKAKISKAENVVLYMPRQIVHTNLYMILEYTRQLRPIGQATKLASINSHIPSLYLIFFCFSLIVWSLINTPLPL